MATAPEAIAAEVMSCDVCTAYFELMDQTGVSGAGFAHYEVLMEWPAGAG